MDNEINKIVEKLINKEIKPYQLDNMFDSKKSVEIRRKYIESLTKTDLNILKITV